MHLATRIRVDPHYVWILRTRITIEETIQLFTMTVKINHEPYLSLFADLLDEGLNRYNLRAILVFF